MTVQFQLSTDVIMSVTRQLSGSSDYDDDIVSVSEGFQETHETSFLIGEPSGAALFMVISTVYWLS